jgi:hypothetical protein
LLAWRQGRYQDAFQQCTAALELYPSHADSLELMQQLKQLFLTL